MQKEDIQKNAQVEILELKSRITKIKNSVDKLKSRTMGTEEKSSEFKDKK